MRSIRRSKREAGEKGRGGASYGEQDVPGKVLALVSLAEGGLDNR